MTVSKLVSESRPILWEHLSDRERRLIATEADNWLKQVMLDANRPKEDANEIHQNRSGRVLFIDGQRGSGKTSLLLTLLEGWRKEGKNFRGAIDVNGQRDLRRPDYSSIKILLPILDFDPLPLGVPLHGWLLGPWREKTRELDKKCIRGEDMETLSEQLVGLFERVVTGWANLSIEGQGVAEKTIALDEKTSGCIDTPRKWRDFVNSAVCRASECHAEGCKAAHPTTFVIAIDDVDLQVEHIPQLLQAIRLLHHPNVVYVLTGDYEHLRFALYLDYVRRHSRVANGCHADILSNENKSEIREYSEKLCDAFLQKALPLHARLRLETLSLLEILDLAVFDPSGESQKDRKVRDLLPDAHWQSIAQQMGNRHITTARKAQHAIDRNLLGRSAAEVDQYAFIADICGVEISPKTEIKAASLEHRRFVMRGRLTTRLGTSVRVLRGDSLRVIVADQPAIYITDPEGKRTCAGEEAHRALLIHLVSQQTDAPTAHDLEWVPNYDVIVTLVRLTKRDTALFQWQWLAAPPAEAVLEFGTLSREMVKLLGDGNSLLDLNEPVVTRWLIANIEWFVSRNRARPPVDKVVAKVSRKLETLKKNPTFKNFADVLKLLDSELKSVNDEFGISEVKRWTVNLLVMSAPYFGLPFDLARNLRDALATIRVIKKPEINKNQRHIVDDAIITESLDSTSPREFTNGEAELDRLTDQFLEDRKGMREKDDWWRFSDYKGRPSSRMPRKRTLVKGTK